MKVIVWDVDDVLNDLMECWFQEAFLARHPECSLRYEDLRENPPARLLGISREEYLQSLDAFRKSEGFQRMRPQPRILSWFLEHGASYRHIALTAVPLVAASASAQWVMRHFGRWIRSFHFVPSHRPGENLPVYDEDKGAYLDWLKHADVLIDDNVENVFRAQQVGVKGMIYPRPWNEAGRSVEEILAALSRL